MRHLRLSYIRVGVRDSLQKTRHEEKEEETGRRGDKESRRNNPGRRSKRRKFLTCRACLAVCRVVERMNAEKTVETADSTVEAANRGTKSIDINASGETSGPRLGLVCITTTDAIRFRTITRTRLLQFPESERPTILRDIYEDNLLRLDRAIAYCRARNIGMYRISSNLLPFADDPAYEDVLNRCAWLLHQAGESARRLNVRLLSHPEQFVVLSSDSANVVANSIRTLQMHAHILDMLGQPRSLACPMEIHGGKSNRADALVRTIDTLDAPIRSRLILENDEDAYSGAEILDVCRRAGVPMVFDAHHHV